MVLQAPSSRSEHGSVGLGLVDLSHDREGKKKKEHLFTCLYFKATGGDGESRGLHFRNIPTNGGARLWACSWNMSRARWRTTFTPKTLSRPYAIPSPWQRCPATSSSITSGEPAARGGAAWRRCVDAPVWVLQGSSQVVEFRRQEVDGERRNGQRERRAHQVG